MARFKIEKVFSVSLLIKHISLLNIILLSLKHSFTASASQQTFPLDHCFLFCFSINSSLTSLLLILLLNKFFPYLTASYSVPKLTLPFLHCFLFSSQIKFSLSLLLLILLPNKPFPYFTASYFAPKLTLADIFSNDSNFLAIINVPISSLWPTKKTNENSLIG